MRTAQELLETCLHQRNKSKSFSPKNLNSKLSNDFYRIYDIIMVEQILRNLEKFYAGERTNKYSLESDMAQIYTLIKGDAKITDFVFIRTDHLCLFTGINQLNQDNALTYSYAFKDSKPDVARVLYFLDRNIKQEIRYRKTLRRLLKLSIKNIDRFISKGEIYA